MNLKNYARAALDFVSGTQKHEARERAAEDYTTLMREGGAVAQELGLLNEFGGLADRDIFFGALRVRDATYDVAYKRILDGAMRNSRDRLVPSLFHSTGFAAGLLYGAYDTARRAAAADATHYLMGQLRVQELLTRLDTRQERSLTAYFQDYFQRMVRV